MWQTSTGAQSYVQPTSGAGSSLDSVKICIEANSSYTVVLSGDYYVNSEGTFGMSSSAGSFDVLAETNDGWATNNIKTISFDVNGSGGVENVVITTA